MEAIGIIPARLQSSRLPGKLLKAETGKPLIQYTWEAARRATSLSDVLIAADDERFIEAARRFGATCRLTGEHPSGTDRIAEVIRRCRPRADIIVNIQGDEPEIDPGHIDLLVELLRAHPSAQMATLTTPIRAREELDSPSCVKAVCAADGRALYFSRAVIPHLRDAAPETLLIGDSPWRLHLGIYAYRREALLQLTELPPSRLEQLEKLEQLRALEAGFQIQVGVVEHRSVGIDTPEDYARFVARHRRAA